MHEALTENGDVESSGRPAPHIPTEVCENIIDMLYSDPARDTLEDIATLQSCALVCRAWSIRSQRMLFYKVQIADGTSCHRFSAILDAGQHLPSYVHQVALIGYHLHTTASILALFPTLFAGRLPNLERIDIVHLLGEGNTWFPTTSDPPKAKPLPYIVLHPRFPAFLSSFTAVSYLYLESTTFRSFTEFVRILHNLPNLETLLCSSVRWTTLGSHPGADKFTKQPDWAADWRRTRPPFAPNIRQLMLRNITMQGAERLILTRGPHLRSLDMTLPLRSDDPEEPAHSGLAIDLSTCLGLEAFTLSFRPRFSIDTHAEFIKGLLASWKPQHLEPLLEFSADGVSHFTRRDFADLLRGLGAITETGLQPVEEPSPASGSENHHGVQYQLSIQIYDWEAEREWWLDHLKSCFPTLARSGRLYMVFSTPRNEYDQWASEEQPSQPDTIPPCQVEDVDLSSPSKDALVSHVSQPA